ncbi:hypothetical protein LCGC14_3012180 [marine sediment metagenome]|uniref:Uncharacterized protein n=1 Tax=marine sediment metagenome TaxID=412755 RepID=A0A0F8WYB1_9ZZZZ
MSLYRDRDKSEAKAMRAIAKVRAANKEIKRLSAENADAQAKEAFALGKLEETLKIEGELRSENKRLEKNLAAARLSNDHLRDRYVPCPDHRDKHKTGDECLMCPLEPVLGKQTP